MAGAGRGRGRRGAARTRFIGCAMRRTSRGGPTPEPPPAGIGRGRTGSYPASGTALRATLGLVDTATPLGGESRERGRIPPWGFSRRIIESAEVRAMEPPHVLQCSYGRPVLVLLSYAISVLVSLSALASALPSCLARPPRRAA